MLSVSAQPQRGWEAGAWLGAAQYFGDLNTNFQVNHPGPLGSLALRYNFNQRIAAMAKVSAMRISGDDSRSTNAFEHERNLSFFTTLLEGSAQIEFNFFPYKHGSKDRFFTPYLFAGLSGFHFDPRTKYHGAVVRLQPLSTEGQSKPYSLNQFGLLYGVGIKYDLDPSWSLNIEVNGRNLMTDYLDDVSTVYPDPGLLQSDLARALSNRTLHQSIEPGRQRGDRKQMDGYGILTVGLMYYFNPLPCPKIQSR